MPVYPYDIKADRVLDVAWYLEQILQSDDLENIVDTIEEKLQRPFRTMTMRLYKHSLMML
jgi:hypothetical protein